MESSLIFFPPGGAIPEFISLQSQAETKKFPSPLPLQSTLLMKGLSRLSHLVCQSHENILGINVQCPVMVERWRGLSKQEGDCPLSCQYMVLLE